jgi:hypothetical protein
MLTDKFAIQELGFYYAYYCDLFRLEEWVACFTEDATFDESDHGRGCHIGHDQIRASGESRHARISQIVHLMNNHLVFDLTPEKARGCIFALSEFITHDGARFRVHVIYEEEYRKVEGVWKISNRVVRKSLPAEKIDAANVAMIG